MTITFGTDGWRAVIADGFTFERVRLVARAVARYLQGEERRQLAVYRPQPATASYPSPYRPASAGVVVGYDTRFLSDRFAAAVAEEIAAAGVPVYLAEEAAPTPAVSLAVRDRAACAAVIVTASHNPPEYNGLKLKPEYASSGLPEIMDALSRFVEREQAATTPPAPAPAAITRFSPRRGYEEEIRRLVDLDRIRACPMEVVIDAMHGAAQGIVPPLLAGGACRVREIRGTFNPSFGGVSPEPIDRNLAALAEALRAGSGRRMGYATDGDADRVGAMDESGRFYNSHEIFAIMLWHLVERRGWRGGVVKTFSTSEMIGRLARHYNLPVYETPIGFKYIVEHMLADDVLIGGEESGGIGVKNHIPERDGPLSGLLLLEACAWDGESLPQVLARIHAITGVFAYDRDDLHLASREVMQGVVERLKTERPATFAGHRVENVLTLDGVKLMLEGGAWILFRPSGTEPVLRVYVEAADAEAVTRILEEGRRVAGAPAGVHAHG